jgi:translation initiation factor eIF-2B subunit epsilon
MDVIKNDFVLVSGDIVSNMDLEKAISAHADRMKKNKDIVMTMFMKETEPGHYVQSSEDDVVVALDKDNILLAYSHSDDSRYLIKRAIFENARSVDIRRDLLDCHLYICSPKLLMLFTDEFDCQDMDDFIMFIHSQEIADHCVYTEVIRDGSVALPPHPLARARTRTHTHKHLHTHAHTRA